jgi:hypothetical protein
VNSGGIRCSKGTPIINKSPTLPFLSKDEQRKKGKKVLTLNKYMAMGPSGARCQEWLCWLVDGSKLLLALLCGVTADCQEWSCWLVARSKLLLCSALRSSSSSSSGVRRKRSESKWISLLSGTKQSYTEGFVVQKELNVWTVIIKCNCNSDVK